MCKAVIVEAPPINCEAYWNILWQEEGIVQFNNESFPTEGTTCLWNFGDGTVSDNCDPQHSFDPGTYTVCLAIEYESCTDEFCETIIIEEPVDPCAGFELDFEFGPDPTNPLGLWVEIISNSAYEFIIFNYGDGTSDNTGYHIYEEAGTYELCVVIEAAPNCRAEVCKAVIVEAPPINCEVFWNILWQEEGTIQFNNESSPFLGMTCLWNFGDGTVSDNCDPQHTFEPGTYTVCLDVEFQGCADEYCENVTIEDPCAGLQASFTYEIDPDDPLAVIFNSTATGNNITDYYWDFGNGSEEDNIQNFTYTYQEAGTYEVCFTIFSGPACRSDYCQEITVEAPPVNCEAFWNVLSTDGLSIQFNNESFPFSGTTCYWDFGDGVSSNDCDPFHTFPAAGNYEICLSIEYEGCTNQHCAVLFVEDPCESFVANFIFEEWMNGATVDFDSQSSTGTIDFIIWDFGDGVGNSSNDPTVTHTYTASGVYEVCLVIENNEGCRDEVCQNIEINIPGAVSLRVAPNQVTNQLTVDLETPKSQEVQFFMYSPASKATGTYKVDVSIGYNQVNINIEDLPRGLYVMVVQFEDGTHKIEKVLKVRE